MIRHHIHRFLHVSVAVMLTLLSGCGESGDVSDPEVVEGTPTQVSVTLSSRPSLMAGTRADGLPVAPDHENEKIGDWFMVFVGSDGTVAKILRRSDAETGISATKGPVEQETFRCILPAGTYSVFAFANMSAEELRAASGVSLTVGSKPDLDAVRKALWNGLDGTDGRKEPVGALVSHVGIVTDANVTKVSNSNLNLWDIDSKAIPMSGYVASVKVAGKVEEGFAVEVVRMVAKIELLLSNSTGADVRVNSVGLDPVTVTPVSLFPDGAAGISYDFLGSHAFTAPAGADYGRLVYTPAETLTVGAGATSDKPVSCRFYIKESLSTRDNGGLFTVWLNMTHKDGGNGVVHYNVTTTINRYINRNDWIRIPIALSRYAVYADALFYPPIGGYPAFLSHTDSDGSQVFTFGTQGEFSIVPHVIDKITEAHLPADRYRFEVESASDPDGIFTRTPFVSPTSSTGLPDEIFGTLGTKEGKATVTIKVMVYDTPYTPGLAPANTHYRTLHIVRDNNIIVSGK